MEGRRYAWKGIPLSIKLESISHLRNCLQVNIRLQKLLTLSKFNSSYIQTVFQFLNAMLGSKKELRKEKKKYERK